MSLQETLQVDLRTAMKGGDEFATGVLRLISAAIHNKEIEVRAKTGALKLSNEEVTRILQSEVKKRKEAAKMFRDGNREDLATQEDKERARIEPYLPVQMNAADVEKKVATILKKSSLTEFGPAMKLVMAELRGKADPGAIAAAVKKYIS